MSEKEKSILKIFAEIIPKLSESDKSYLIGLGEGMAIKTRQQETIQTDLVTQRMRGE